MARDKPPWVAEFRQRMAAYDEVHGINRPTTAPAVEDPPLPGDSYGAVQAARAEWERSPAIRAEFESFERFLAFRKADAKGLIKILRKT